MEPPDGCCERATHHHLRPCPDAAQAVGPAEGRDPVPLSGRKARLCADAAARRRRDPARDPRHVGPWLDLFRDGRAGAERFRRGNDQRRRRRGLLRRGREPAPLAAAGRSGRRHPQGHPWPAKGAGSLGALQRAVRECHRKLPQGRARADRRGDPDQCAHGCDRQSAAALGTGEDELRGRADDPHGSGCRTT